MRADFGKRQVSDSTDNGGSTSRSFVLDGNEAYSLPLNTLGDILKTDFEKGLKEREAEERLVRIGSNLVPKVRTRLLRVYLEPLSNWLIVSYIIVSAFLGIIALLFLPQLWLQVTLWLPVVFANIVFIFVQTAKAQTKLTALERLSAPMSHVVRDGKVVNVPSESVVPGDIILVKQGDMITADARLVTSSNLRVNEATLTGESNEVEKLRENDSGLEDKSTPKAKSNLFLGTFVVAGTATALVTATGGRTTIGTMAGKIGRLSFSEVSLRKRINKLAMYLALIAVAYIAVSISYSLLVLYFEGALTSVPMLANEIAKRLLTSLSIMPINIPLLITGILLTGAFLMSEEKIIIRNLNAIETLARVSVLCADKTGTITNNRMTAEWIYIPLAGKREQLFYIRSEESSPRGRIVAASFRKEFNGIVEETQDLRNKEPVKVEANTPLEFFLAAALLNNEILISKDEKRNLDPCQRNIDHTISGDATDTAMLCLFERSHLDPELYRERFELVQSWPFDPKSKLISSVFKDRITSRYMVFTKGATETLLAGSRFVLGEGIEAEPFSKEEKNDAANRVEFFSKFGQRIISFAFAETDDFSPENTRTQAEKDLIYLGFAAISDPPRAGVFEAVSELREAGIKPVMITGDSPTTAMSIAKEVGIAGPEQVVVEGSEVESLSDQDFQKVAVFARITPDAKTAIVSRFQAQNCVVAMTGDGVNDAQAISKANVGIAMGLTGTDVARQAANLVLGSDSFSSIAGGIREGRAVFEKIQNLVFFYIAVNLAEAMVYFVSSFISGFSLMLIWQLAFIFATAHLVPPLALIIDKPRKDIMREKPHNGAFVSGHRKTALIVFTLSLALVLSLSYFVIMNGVLPVYPGNKVGYVPNFHPLDPFGNISWEQAKARTIFLSVAIVAESTLILSLRRLNKPMFKSLREDANRRLWLFVLAIPVVLLILMYVPAIQYALIGIGIDLDIIYLVPIDWLLVLSLGLTPIFLLELVKIVLNKKKLLKSVAKRGVV